MVNKIILRLLILTSLCTPYCNACDTQEGLNDLLKESQQIVGRITLEELKAANPMTLQIQALSTHIQALEEDQAKSLDLTNILIIIGQSRITSEWFLSHICNVQIKYFRNIAGVDLQEIRCPVHRWNPAEKPKDDHDDVYLGASAQNKYADETAVDLYLAESINLKYPQLLAFAIRTFGDNFDTKNSDDEDEGVAPVPAPAPSTNLNEWINRNWDCLFTFEQRSFLQKYKEMYISIYDNYHQFILKHLPGRTFLNALNK
jgi:hypothetical protein